MEERWYEIRKGGDFQSIGRQYGISPITARLIRNRDVVGEKEIQEYLHGTIENLHDGLLMKDMNKAVDIIKEKIEEKCAIRIIGDYDIDGVNATYILLQGLERLGAIVDSDIPDRIKNGYGLNIDLIEHAIADGIDTIITCDNGIAAKYEIEYAKRQGVTVIITDHHEVPYEEIIGANGVVREYLLPKADAIVNPKQEECAYPFDGLCGAAVAYKLVESLYQVMGQDVEDVDFLMENVAIATIGDVMDLVGENRIFVKQGLEMLKCTQNLGLEALMNLTMDDVEKLEAYHIGFVIGPCLNASGRLDTAKRALELLMARTSSQAAQLASELKDLNDNRKELTIQGVEAAKELVEKELSQDKVLVVYLPDCHESLAGIIAGRLREVYHKPAFVLTKGEKTVKGSGRSIEAYDMYEEMTKCKDIFLKYGGHKLAAGLSIEEKNVGKLRSLLNQTTHLTDEELVPKIAIDIQLPIAYVNEQVIEELRLLEPFGKGNTKPHFAEKNLEVTRLQVLGKNQNVVKLRLRDTTGYEIIGIYFGDVEKILHYIEVKYGNIALSQLQQGRPANVKMSFVYYPTINQFNGQKEVQLVIQHYR